VSKRLSRLGIRRLYLPQLTYDKPHDPHIAVLAPPVDVLKTRKQIVVIINDSAQDLGILAYRQLQQEPGLNGGSIINFIKAIIARTTEAKDGFDIFKDGAEIGDHMADAPGVIMLNNGQLLYSYTKHESLTMRSWLTLPRKSVSHDLVKIDEEHNRIEGNRTSQEHIACAWHNIIQNPEFVSSDADLYVVAIENGADALINVLDANFEAHGSRIKALAVINTYKQLAEISDPALKSFLRDHARRWQPSTLSPNAHDCIKLPNWDRKPLEEFTMEGMYRHLKHPYNKDKCRRESSG
jgi:hypothetical protein